MPIERWWRCVDALPSNGAGGTYAHYEHRELRVPGWTACDLRAVIRAHQERWLDTFDEWHARLGRAAIARSPWWWLMPASRPNLWAQQELLKPLFFAAAACAWRTAHPTAGPIYLVGCPAKVRWHLAEFDGEGGPPGDAGVPQERRWKTLARALAGCRAGLAYALSHGFRRTPQLQGRVLFYSHVVHLDALREIGDHFFGQMIEIADAAMPGEVLTGYLIHEGVDRAETSRLLRGLGRRFTFVLDHLTVWDACWAAVTGLRACRSLRDLHKAVPPIRVGRWTSRAFGRRYVNAYIAGRPPVLELAMYRALRRLLRDSGVRTVVYPYEEKGLERALLQTCAEASPPVRAVGYAHAAHTSAHLALRTRSEDLPTPPQPSRLLSTGPRAKEFLVHWGRKRASEVAAVGSHRYTEPLGGGRAMTARQHALRILVVIGQGYEVSLLANCLERRPDLFAQDEVMIRRYQFAWKSAQDRGMGRLNRMVPHVQVAHGRLEDQLAWCDVALFSSTSVGLQAMLAGRLAIYAHLHDLCEADPLLGSQACFARCATADELAEALARARALSDGEQADWVRTQRAFAATVFGPLNRERLVAQLWDEEHA